MVEYSEKVSEMRAAPNKSLQRTRLRAPLSSDPLGGRSVLVTPTLGNKGFSTEQWEDEAVKDETARRLYSGPAARLILAVFGLCLGGIARSQMITEFPIPTARGSPYDIAAGPDGALWFTEYVGNQ